MHRSRKPASVNRRVEGSNPSLSAPNFQLSETAEQGTQGFASPENPRFVIGILQLQDLPGNLLGMSRGAGVSFNQGWPGVQ